MSVKKTSGTPARNLLTTLLLFLAFLPQNIQVNKLLCHKAHQLYYLIELIMEQLQILCSLKFLRILLIQYLVQCTRTHFVHSVKTKMNFACKAMHFHCHQEKLITE